ncbi:MAG: transcription termination factor NusA [Rickettsiales bacterium]|jgi:N utilization substance protein A|nr:transcription termination factor NusA [Rickettsiales bacterium]
MIQKLSTPRPELVAIANSVSVEKNISPEIVFTALESAVEKVAKNKYGYDYDIVATIDRKDGTIAIFKRTTVVGEEKMFDEEGVEIEFDSNKMMKLADAKKRDESLEIGSHIDEELLPVDFGRSNFQSVRQIVLSKIKAAEKEKEFAEFEDKTNTIINGIVKRVEYGSVAIDINGKAEGLIRRSETIPRENLHLGDRVRALVLEVRRDNNGPQVFLTRSHPQFLAELFKAEIPEVYEGVVEVKAVARDPGSRAKVAVMSHDSSVDPVGAAVGTKGSRIQNIVNELAGEKIDVIEWTPNVAALAVDALSPAKVSKVIVDEEAKKIDAVVEDDQLSLAIGRHGQNVRLASQLLGWGIDVMSEDQSSEKRQKDIKERTEKFIAALDIDDVIAHLLVVEGFGSVEDVAMVELSELKAIEGFDEGLASELQIRAKAYLEREKEKFVTEANKLGISDELRMFEGMAQETILKLGEAGVKTLDNLADLASDELREIAGEETMPADEAEKIVMKAREHWFAEEKKDQENKQSKNTGAEADILGSGNNE